MLESHGNHSSYRILRVIVLLLCGLASVTARASVDGDGAAPQLLPICVASNRGGERCGLLERNGKWAVTPRYSALYVRADGWRFVRDHKSGLLHADGKPWLEAAYESIGAFHDGRAYAKRKGKAGLIDRQGHWVVKPKYFWMGALTDGRAPACAWAGPSNGGHSVCRYVDRDGKVAFDGEYAEAGTFKYGMAVVQPLGSNTISVDGRRVGVIDRDGASVIDVAPRYALHVLGPDRLLEASRDRYALIDRDGRTLFEVPHGGLLKPVGAGLLAYRKTRSGRIGLRRVATNEVVVAPKHGFGWTPHFSHGSSTTLAADKNVTSRPMLIDSRGHVLIPPGRYSGIGPFFDGVGPVARDRDHWQLVTTDGQHLTPRMYKRIHAAWKSAEQTDRIGDVWAAIPSDAPRSQVWINARGVTLARRQTLACGVEVIRDNHDRIIWPASLDDDCRDDAS